MSQLLAQCKMMQEFAGTSEKVWGLVPVVCFLFAGAIVLIAAPWSRISGPVWSSV